MAIQNLNSKLVLITGAGSGIGMEIAIAFAGEKARLVLVDISEKGLETARRTVTEKGAQCWTCQVDVSDLDAMEDLAREVERDHEVPDVLVNNAGVAFLGSFNSTPIAQWLRILDINVMGVVHGCHFFLPMMLKAGGIRHIVNMASAAGLAACTNMSAYSASKHAVMGLSDSLALELAGTPVSVSVVCPGVINTPIAQFASTNMGSDISAAQAKKLGNYYQDNGAPPSVVGAAVVDAVKKNSGLVLVGPFAALTYHLRRISRNLLHKIMLVEAKKMGW